MLTRSLGTSAVLVLSAWIVHGGTVDESGPSAALESIPLMVGEWTGRDEAPFDDETLVVLGADEYVNRTYVTEAGGSMRGVNMYVGYYASQRQGDAIHSPMNCLPGTGWQPVARGRVSVASAGIPPFEANRVLVQKGRDRQLVIYWYEGRGRRVAGEYASKLLLIADAVRLNRTDGALVRLSTPVNGSEPDAEHGLLTFAAEVVPLLAQRIPGSTEGRDE